MADEGIKVEHKDKNHPYAFLVKQPQEDNQDYQPAPSLQTIEPPASDGSSQHHTSDEKWQ